MGLFSLKQEIAMDLGTANTIIISDDKIVVDEPSVVALDRRTDKMIAVGEKAKMMYEKTHDNIRTIRPLRDGVIADFSACEQMMRGLIKMVHTGSRLFSPSLRMVIGVPSGSTEVELRAVRDSAEHADGRDVYLIFEPMAAAIGIGIATGKATEAISRQRYQATLAQADCLEGDTPEQRRVRRLMKLNMDWFMQTLLDRKDRMSMWNALEVRVPFCDWRIAEYLYNVPPTLRDLGGQEKGLLRAAMAGWLPEEVAHRKKSPYPKTVHPVYLRLVSRRLQELLDEGSSPLFQLVRREALEALLTHAGPQPWYGQLMTAPQTIAYFLQLDHWLRAYGVRLV